MRFARFPRLLCAAALALAAHATHAATLTLLPLTQEVQSGGLFSVELGASGLADFAPPSLARYELGLTFSAELLKLESVSFGDLGLGDPTITGQVTEGPGSDPSQGVAFLAQDAGLQLEGFVDAFQPDAFRLATLTFLALGSGSAQIGVLPFPTLIDAGGEPLEFDFASPAVTVNVAAVPEPATGACLLIGLAALAFGARHGAGGRTASRRSA